MIDCKKLAKYCMMEKAATMAEIELTQSEFHLTFPKDYVELLSCSNGVVVKDILSLRLYAIDEIGERNTTYEVAIYAPTMLCIGDDGGGRGIFLDCSSEEGAVYLLDLGSMSISDAVSLAANIGEWIQSAFDLKDLQGEKKSRYIDVYLLHPPSGGARGLFRLKKDLNLAISTRDLRQVLKNIPFRLLRSVPFERYAPLCKIYNDTEACLGLFEVDQPNRPVSALP